MPIEPYAPERRDELAMAAQTDDHRTTTDEPIRAEQVDPMEERHYATKEELGR